MKNLSESGFRAISVDEAAEVFGGDFIVPIGPDSNEDPNAKFILIPAGLPGYDQSTENQEEYYNQYRDYDPNTLLTFGVNQNNNETFANTLELATNISYVGTRSNDVIIPTPIANVLTFTAFVNQFPAPHEGSAPFVNNTAQLELSGFQNQWSVNITATITDRGDGTTGATITMVTSSPF